MQPNPMAETSRLLFPSLRFCIVVHLDWGPVGKRALILRQFRSFYS